MSSRNGVVNAPAAFGRIFILLSLLLFVQPASAQWQRGRVVKQSTAVYRSADFDSPVLGQIKGNTEWDISTRVFGAFYQVRIKSNMVGYVSDVDILPVSQLKGSRRREEKKSASQSAEKKAKAEDDSIRKNRPFAATNFWGLQYASIRYRESTMGLRPSDQMNFIGFNMSGPNVVFDGVETVFNFLVSLGPPKYYAQATQMGADGFVLFTNFLIEYNSTHGKNTMTFFGIGPLFKYSRVVASLIENGETLPYSLEDMNLGLIFNLGITQRVGGMAFRGEAQFFWEKLQYNAFVVSAQFEM